ncbi:MAG: argininosuccinate lyase [Bacteroidota bacterium]|jgi:argininosuccinate lyase|nr:argininosuccinate lyase [Bacteroidota bacterium]
MNLWDKGGTIDASVHAFTIGSDPEHDRALARYDVLGSLAHAQMLCECGLLPADEWDAVRAVLREIHASAVRGRFVIEEGVEDVHTQVERILTRETGDAGKRIHTARSRNDQVLVDIKLFLRDRIRDVVESCALLVTDLLSRSDQHADVMIPGFTHGQAAMPSSFGQWFAAHAEGFVEDLLLLHAAYRMADRNPLGSAAGYGTSFPIDRDRTTELLGFETLHVNAVDAQLARGKTERFAAIAFASVAATLSRFAVDLCQFASDNYAFVRLREEITTGSSIMPHKHNPDVFELVRARCNRIQSLPNDISMCMLNLPSGYHRDFQVLKELLFPAITTLLACLRITRHSLEFVDIQEGIVADARYRAIHSVDAIQQRMRTGVPFRDAYRAVAADIAAGRLEESHPPSAVHVGSIGNLSNDRIRAALAAELVRFPFARRDTAFDALLSD